MKELIGKARKSESLLPGKRLINEHEVSGKQEIASEFNTFFRKYQHRVGQKNSKCVKSIKSYF